MTFMKKLMLPFLVLFAIECSGAADASAGCREYMTALGRLTSAPYGYLLRDGPSPVQYAQFDFMRGQLRGSMRTSDPIGVPIKPSIFSRAKDNIFALGILALGGRNALLGSALAGVFKDRTKYRFVFPTADSFVEFKTETGHPWFKSRPNRQWSLPDGGLSIGHFAKFKDLEAFIFASPDRRTLHVWNYQDRATIRLGRETPIDSLHFKVRSSNDGRLLTAVSTFSPHQAYVIPTRRVQGPTYTATELRNPLNGEKISKDLAPSLFPLDEGIAVLVTRDGSGISDDTQRPVGSIGVFLADDVFDRKTHNRVDEITTFLAKIDILKLLHRDTPLAISAKGDLVVTPELGWHRESTLSDQRAIPFSVRKILEASSLRPDRMSQIIITPNGTTLIKAYELNPKDPRSTDTFEFEESNLKRDPFSVEHENSKAYLVAIDPLSQKMINRLELGSSPQPTEIKDYDGWGSLSLTDTKSGQWRFINTNEWLRRNF